jgi:hypothetical protein
MNGTCTTRLRIPLFIACAVICICARGQNKQEEEPRREPPRYVIRFERMGGYFGVHDAFFIYPDGLIADASGRTARVSPATVADWIKNISPAAAADRSEVPDIETYCLDCLYYRITFYDADRIPTVLRMNPLTKAPSTAHGHLEQMRGQILGLFK